ncbi:hypothetical protein [Streptomyces flaveus]|uniref:hypothetical protein n=1 Tax=Streptomyces flaveus TaxID=66370 RepID=UPI0033301ED0
MATAKRSTEIAKRTQIQEAKATRDELEEALAGAGVLLPSLGLDALSLASDYLPPLVDLGRCNPDTARKLAAALREITR